MSKDKRVVWVGACTLAGLLLAFGVGFSAVASQQSTNGNTNSNAGGGMNSNAGGMRGNSNSNAGMAADAKFMATAAQGGMAEVAMARVALERASSDAVRQYAQKMIDDHTANNSELMQLAAGKGVTLPAAPDAKHQALMTKMSGLSGMQFDMEYIKNSGVKDHEAMEKLMLSESTRGKDADARAFAARTLPAVRMHLTMARAMAAGMKAMHSNAGGGTRGNMNSNTNGNTNGNSNRGTNSNNTNNSNR